MADQKKDMTGLMDYAKSIQDSGQAPPVPPGSVMEEQKIEKVDDFESLEDYGKANPTPEPSADPLPQEDAFVTTPESEPPPGLDNSISGMDSMNSVPGLGGGEEPVAHEPPLETQGFEPMAQPVPSSDASFSPSGGDMSGLQLEAPALEPEPVLTPAPVPEFAASSAPSAPQSFTSHVAPEDPSRHDIEAPLKEPLRPATKTPSSPKQPMEKLKQYSEQMTPGRTAVPASFPFSLLITGELAPEEKERLIDLLSRQNMGIREIDLEPQFESGKILIPRISEYAGVMIVSALRSTRAKMRLGPSDSIFATPDTQDSTEEELDGGQRTVDAYTSDHAHTAEDLPITTEGFLPGQIRHAVVDIVTASAALKTMVIEAEHSPEYQTLLEALQRELKYKAYRKGATAIVNFSVQLTQMHLATHYRVMVTGSAIRSAT